jgi:hypothetical protein
MSTIPISSQRDVSVCNDVNSADLKLLASQHDWPAISIFIPTFKSGTDTKQNITRIKNSYSAVRAVLNAAELSEPYLDKLLEPLCNLQDDYAFSQQQLEGLAVFISPQFARLYCLEAGFDEQINIDTLFQLKPLLAAQPELRQFYVLHIGESDVHLWSGNKHGLTPVELPAQLPKSVDALLDIEEHGPLVKPNLDSPVTPVGGDRRSVYHGGVQMPAQEKDNQYMLNLMTEVEKSVQAIGLKGNNQVPLVFNGSADSFALYKQVNTYKHLLPDCVGGNYVNQNLTELHSKALDLLEPYWQKQTQLHIDRYLELAGRPITTNKLAEILPAAHAGAIDTLICAENASVHGSYNVPTNQLFIEPEIKHDLINEAIVHTIATDGRVIVVPRESMPEHLDLAAILRYEFKFAAEANS